jgi:hypothetical protein
MVGYMNYRPAVVTAALMMVMMMPTEMCMVAVVMVMTLNEK